MRAVVTLPPTRWRTIADHRAIAVWGGLLGSVLILLRKRLAVPVLLASFASMMVTSIHSVVIFFDALGHWIYARAMAAKGVLA